MVLIREDKMFSYGILFLATCALASKYYFKNNFELLFQYTPF